MLVGELLTNTYNLDAMVEIAKTHEIAETAVEQAAHLFGPDSEVVKVSASLKRLGHTGSRGIDSYHVKLEGDAPALITRPYESFDHKGIRLDSRLVRLEMFTFSRLQRPGTAALLLVGLSHERQKDITEARYNWGVLNISGRDSLFVNIAPDRNVVGQEVKVRRCTTDESKAIVRELQKAVGELSIRA